MFSETFMFLSVFVLFLTVCSAEHPEDKQFPVQPAARYSCCVCYHPQLAPTGLGLLRHANLLQSCWWVWPYRHKQTPSARTVCSARCWFSGSQCWKTRGEFVLSVFVAAFVFTDYSLSSAEISSLQGFSSPGLSLGSMSAWQQHQLGQAALNSLVWVTHLQTKAHSPDAPT